MLFGVRWLPDTKGEYAIAAGMDNAAGQMAVCIPMVMLGYFQLTLTLTPTLTGYGLEAQVSSVVSATICNGVRSG